MAAAPRIATVRNPVGAGDVLASALAAALERGEPLLEAARHGVAAAAASVESPTAGELDAARAAELLGAVVARAGAERPRAPLDSSFHDPLWSRPQAG